MIELDHFVPLNTPHPKQQEFLDRRKRFNVLKCGRRFGKTELAQELISETVEAGGIVGYFSPTYKDLYEVWQEMKRVFHPIILSVSETVKQIQFLGGAKADFWSMDDPDSGRGRKYHRVIIDECEKAGKFQEAWEQTIRATLTDYAGDGYFLSTPQFGETFFKALCKNETLYPDWKTFVYTTYDNPYINAQEVEQARQLLHPSVFDCEYLALDVDGRTLNPFAHQFDRDFHVSTKAVFDPKKKLIISVDFNLQPFSVCFSHVWQDGTGTHDHTFDEADIDHGSIPAMAELIKVRYGKHLYNAEITGDFMGRRGDISQRDNASLYVQLIRLLGMSERQLMLPREGNPTHENSKADTNLVLWRSKSPDTGWEFIIHPDCKGSIRDFVSVQWDNLKGQIKKRDRTDITQRADFLDAHRYRINVYWRSQVLKFR